MKYRLSQKKCKNENLTFLQHIFKQKTFEHFDVPKSKFKLIVFGVIELRALRIIGLEYVHASIIVLKL